MGDHTALTIDYFSDVLCIWAYAAQIRIETLSLQFGPLIKLKQRFIPVFGDTAQRIGQGWAVRGGYPAYNQHVHKVARDFEQIEVHPDLWKQARPASSGTAHLFLKAVELCQQAASDGDEPLANGEDDLDKAVREVRLGFFRDNRDVGDLRVLLSIAESLSLPLATVEEHMKSGHAFAALCRDAEMRDHYRVEGSPTLVLNEGRQKLYGNVGYRGMEANVQELLRAPAHDQLSWC